MTAGILNYQSDASTQLLTEESIYPPLLRERATIPGYWTPEEIALEISSDVKKVNYAINGRPERRQEASLFAYRWGRNSLVPDQHALRYICENRKPCEKSA